MPQTTPLTPFLTAFALTFLAWGWAVPATAQQTAEEDEIANLAITSIAFMEFCGPFVADPMAAYEALIKVGPNIAHAETDDGSHLMHSDALPALSQLRTVEIERAANLDILRCEVAWWGSDTTVNTSRLAQEFEAMTSEKPSLQISGGRIKTKSEFGVVVADDAEQENSEFSYLIEGSFPDRIEPVAVGILPEHIYFLIIAQFPTQNPATDP